MITNAPKTANARGLVREAARTLRRGAVLAMAMALALVAPSAVASEPRTETAPPTGAKPRTTLAHGHHTDPGRPGGPDSGYGQEPKSPPGATEPSRNPEAPPPAATEPTRPEAPAPGTTEPPRNPEPKAPGEIAHPTGVKPRPAPEHTERDEYPESEQAEHGELPQHGEGPEQVRFTPAQKPQSLPFTGLDLRWEIGVGVLLIAAGCLIAIVRRFRSNG